MNDSVLTRKYKIGDIVLYTNGISKKFIILSINGTYSNGRSYLYYGVREELPRNHPKKVGDETIIECDVLEHHSMLDRDFIREKRNKRLKTIGV